MFLLLIFSFVAGIVTVLSPCILPVLPIVLASSVGGGRRRPVGIVVGFAGSFTLFTLFLTALVNVFGISAESLRTVSIVVIAGFGLSLLFPKFQLVLEKLWSRVAQAAPRVQGDGFGSGLLVGASLGLLWTPCVGPILASVITLALTGTVSGAAFLITAAYSIGTSLPLLAILLGGRRLIQKIPALARNAAKIQQIFGLLMIATAIAIALNWDRRFQTWMLTVFPQYGAGLTRFESAAVIQDELTALTGGQVAADDMGKPMNELTRERMYPLAPELTGGTAWLNSEPLLFGENLKGKVVLVDFWTYTCINCIRTFPHLVEWYERYKDDGFVIVGVHAPEFEFEKDRANVLAAMEQYGLEYPVVQDNDFQIWRAYNNRYWPAHYLVDTEGRVRYTHFGEGNYEETEQKIRELLGEVGAPENSPMTDTTPRRPLTPETYLGYGRAEAYVLENSLSRDAAAHYDWSGSVAKDAVALRGAWQVGEEAIVARENGASLTLNFLAQTVYLVVAPLEQEGKIEVLLDGKPVPAEYRSADMNGTNFIPVTQARKYDLVDLGDDYGRHTLELRFTPGIAAYAFTFGS
jgi:cytochrome c biogenesis protein CcdA/thiol-disulfide isomerase/thioredoxin